tara:strand:- start:38917 stop:39948 length:1032 start_codon:yes stop_codon:yes gene_type:complete
MTGGLNVDFHRNLHDFYCMTSSNNPSVRSMTGQGYASTKGDLGQVSVEVRTVNHRGFKCSPRVSDSLSSLESKIEALARSLIHRGSIHLNVSYRPPSEKALPKIDGDVLQAYYHELNRAREAVGGGVEIDLASLMSLPGVIRPAREDRRDDTQLWDFVREGIVDAFENLNQMRSVEGANMAETLEADCDLVRSHVQRIAELAPRAVDTYRARLQAKIERILAENNLESQPVDLLREVQVYADRIDVSEEITRLDSHLKMFSSVLAGDGHGLAAIGKSGKSGSQKTSSQNGREPTGRKLDFIIQEMFRETNTIGSKSADAEVSAHVVEVKCAIERMRELVQNLE